MPPQSYYKPGTLIAGRYEVAGRPLMGGMGVVYFCFDHKEEHPVVLKTFRPEFLPDRAARDRFLREGTIWIELGRHPHIVRAYRYEYIGDGREIYLVLELVEQEIGRANASLRAWLVPGRALPVNQSLLFGLQIARGMSYVNQTIPGFVHRDLKPENVLVGRDKLEVMRTNRLRITDFGLAAVLQNPGVRQSELSESSKQSRIGQRQLTQGVIGTPLYMAPEQWHGENISTRTDVYALGCILYEMLTGRRAAEGNNWLALKQAHCTGNLRPLPERIPEAVSEVVKRCLAREPQARYNSCEAVEDALSVAYNEVMGQPAPGPESLRMLDIMERIAYGWAYSGIARSYLDLDKAGTALSYFGRAVEVGRTEVVRELEASGLNGLGLTYVRLGETRRALDYYEQALEICRGIDDLQGEAAIIGNLGEAYRYLGDIYRAISFFERQLAITRETNDREGEGNALACLGVSYKNLGDAQKAIEYHKQALKLFCEIGNRRGESSTLSNLGSAHIEMGEAQSALKFFEKALMIDREIGDRGGEGSSLNNLGNACLKLGNVQQAIGYFEQALVIAREIGTQDIEADILVNMGASYGKLGNTEQVIDFLQEALAIAREIGRRQTEGGILTNLGIAYRTIGEAQQAIAVLEQALIIVQEVGNRHEQAQTLNQLGLACTNLGDVESAVEYHKRAFQILEEVDDKEQTILCCSSLTLLLIQQGRFTEALPYAEQAVQMLVHIGDASTAQEVQQLVDHIKQMLNKKTSHSGELTSTEYDNRGFAVSELKQHDKATSDHNWATQLESEPADARAYANLGISCCNLQRYGEALANFEKAIHLDPTDPAFYYHRGLTYATLQRYDEALVDFGQAIRLDPTNAEIHLKVGAILANGGRLNEALPYLEKAGQLGDPQGAALAAQTREILGTKAGALFPEVQRAFQALQRANSLDEIQSFVTHFPFIVEANFIAAIEQAIEQQVPTEHRPAFAQRLAWLRQIANEQKRQERNQ